MNVNSRIQKALCFLLVLCMVLQYVPMASFAATEDETLAVCTCEPDDETHAPTCPLYVSAEVMTVTEKEMMSGACGDNLTWNLSDEGVLTISGTGEMWDYHNSFPDWYYHENLVECIIQEGVTSIGADAFYACLALKTLRIPASLTTIGESAFLACHSLTDVYYNGTIQQWGKLVHLEGAEHLTVANIHCTDGDLAANTKAFGVCGDDLSWILDEDGVITISGTGAMWDYVDEDPGWTNCRSLITACIIEDGVTSVGDGAFYWCRNMEILRIPSSVTSIGRRAFNSCESLSDVHYDGTKDQWAQIDLGENNGSLDLIVIRCTDGNFGEAEPIPEPDPNVYYSGTCGDNLTWRVYKDQVLVISGTGEMWNYQQESNPGWYQYRHLFQNCVIEEGVTSIGEFAFYKCSLTDVEIADSVTQISKRAFFHVSGLKNIVIPDSVATIGEGVFSYCSHLESIEIPANVTTIGLRAFYRSEDLKDVYYGGTQAQWAQVELLPGNAPLCNAAVHCTDGDAEPRPDAIEERCGDNVFWSFADGTLTISGTGPMWDFVGMPTGWDMCDLDITTCVIEEGVTSIGSMTFSFSTWLRTLKIPASLTSIGDYAFMGCSSLTHVYYRGTMAQWEEITIGVHNDEVIHANISCEDGFKWFEYYGKCGPSLTWTLTPQGVLTISGTGEMWEYIVSDHPTWFDYSKMVEECIIEEGVTNVGGAIFWNHYNLKKVEIADSVTRIEEGAFSLCDALTTIRLPAGLTEVGPRAFYECAALSEVYYGGTMAQWSEVAIYAMNEPLRNSVIHCTDGDVQPSADPRWGDCGNYAFWRVDDNGVLTISGTGEMWDFSLEYHPTFYLYREEITSCVIEEGITSIGDFSFYKCGSLTSVEIPSSVTSIDQGAFFECILTDVVIPDGVETIGFGAFNACDRLTSVQIPVSVKTIDEYAFDGCTSLTDVHYTGSEMQWSRIDIMDYNDPLIHANIHYVGIRQGSCGDNVTWTLDGKGTLTISGTGGTWDYTISDDDRPTFYTCWEEIESCVIEEGVTAIGNHIFRGCSNLASVAFPSSLTSIGKSAFAQCALTDVVIPDGVTDMGREVFNGCTSLTSAKLPSGLTVIMPSMFIGCVSLTSVEIPASVTTISEYAFNNCLSLTDIYYGGSPAQWAQIHIYTHNNELTNANVHYGESDPEPEPAPELPDAEYNAFEWEVLRLTNRERQQKGLEPLTANNQMFRVADIRAEEIIESFSHDRPNGTSCFTVFEELGIPYNALAENIAAGQTAPEWVVASWMNSSGHRSNILDPDLTHLGVGYRYAADDMYGYYWVQMFHSHRNCAYSDFQLNVDALEVEPGQSLDDQQLWAKLTCAVCGDCYLPILSEYCTGYDPETPGTQTVTVSVLGFDATLEITVSDSATVLGDVTGDGKVTAADYSRLLAHVKKTSVITDEAALKAADVTGDGKITAADYSRLLAHVKKVSPLW